MSDSNKYDPDFGFNEECEQAWRGYLNHFYTYIYPMFAEHGISKDTALSCWFINRLRNAIPDDNISNGPEKEDWQI